MNEATTFIFLIYSVLFNTVFIILFFLVYKRPMVNFIRRFLYAKKGFGIVNLIGKDKRIVEYFTKVIGEKIRLNKRTYITDPDALLISSQINESLRISKGKETYKQKIDKELTKLYKLQKKSKFISFNRDQRALTKKIKAYEGARDIQDIGDINHERMLLKGNMPCYHFKEGNIEPLNLMEMKMGEISSKHMDDIVVDALTAPKSSMFNWFQENKKMLMILFGAIIVMIFIAVSYIQGQPGGLEAFLIG